MEDFTEEQWKKYEAIRTRKIAENPGFDPNAELLTEPAPVGDSPPINVMEELRNIFLKEG
jgi:hypothetical protein